jgi:hypothetical protein
MCIVAERVSCIGDRASNNSEGLYSDEFNTFERTYYLHDEFIRAVVYTLIYPRGWAVEQIMQTSSARSTTLNDRGSSLKSFPAA